MSKFNTLALVAALGMVSAIPNTATAEVKIYPYAASHNYCPAGLQPVSIDGVICCGKPNTRTSYQSTMSHPVAKKKHHKVVQKKRHVRRAKAQCQLGTKGCTFD
ncbi:hypothetical protein ABMC88_05920 [Sulfitobacter sp. HNIBRBA2951]|uniref:hypothetical protein n=1 Tax=Sulfitobacter aquimarinus TaxID=3158557 RepID=UPI0032E01835